MSRTNIIIAAVAAVAVFAGLVIYMSSGDRTEQRTDPVPPRATEDQRFVFPTFDTVRIAEDGRAVIAGRAPAGSEVFILDGEDVLASVRASADGSWAVTIDDPLEPGELQLRLRARLPSGDTILSEQSVAISVPTRAGEEAIVILTDPGKASKVIQGPGAGSERGEILLETIDYGEDGSVILSGKSIADRSIRAYLDNDLIGETLVGSDERWTLTSERSIAPGAYTLRLDQIDDTGAVRARIALPFRRSTDAEIAALKDNKGQVVIQPGDNLWTISRLLYGQGVLYTVIYEANEDSIRDPDLIYPGQVFATPRKF